MAHGAAFPVGACTQEPPGGGVDVNSLTRPWQVAVIQE